MPSAATRRPDRLGAGDNHPHRIRRGGLDRAHDPRLHRLLRGGPTLRRGRAVPDAYDDRWFGGYVQRITGTGVREIFTPNPPAMSLMAVPFAGFRPPARTARSGCSRPSWHVHRSHRAVAAPCAANARRLGCRSSVFLLLVNPPVLANLRRGPGIPLRCGRLCACSPVALIRDRQPLAGATLGVLFALKATGASVVPAARQRRGRWRAVAAGIAAIGVAGRAHGGRASIAAMWIEYPRRRCRNAEPTDDRGHRLSIDVESGAPTVRARRGLEPTGACRVSEWSLRSLQAR